MFKIGVPCTLCFMDGRVLFGTSTWTYPGWEGLVYVDVERYGKHFKRESLAEYARCGQFECVGVDGTFYRPPTITMLRDYARQLPDGFPCVVKVWREITTPFFSKHFGPAGAEGTPNPDFLSAERFNREFLPVFRAYFRPFVGAFVVEVPWVSQEQMAAEAFYRRLDSFLSAVEEDWPMSVELRSQGWLSSEYFELLKGHGAAHAFNVWTRMPLPHRVLDEFPIALDCADFSVCRALVSPGMMYADAVKRFAPYDRIQQVEPEVRDSLLALARKAMEKGVTLMVAVNNRLEGCAPLTIEVLRERLGSGT